MSSNCRLHWVYSTAGSRISNKKQILLHVKVLWSYFLTKFLVFRLKLTIFSHGYFDNGKGQRSKTDMFSKWNNNWHYAVSPFKGYLRDPPISLPIPRIDPPPPIREPSPPLDPPASREGLCGFVVVPYKEFVHSVLYIAWRS